MKRISIITVCFNAESLIEKTIESILDNAEYSCEYIIIDGKSSDNTIKIAESYKDSFRERSIDYKIFSSTDLGIYDAMNKGVQNALGEWAIFINAGDILNCNLFKEVFNGFEFKEYDIIYGDVIVFDQNSADVVHASRLSIINYNLPFCHQSTLCRTELLKQYPFDLRFKMLADYNFFLKAYHNGARFKYFPVTISKFLKGGFSAKANKQYIREKIVIIAENQNSVLKKLYYLLRFIKTLVPINRSTITKMLKK